MNADLEQSASLPRQLLEDRGISAVHGAVCAGTAETQYLRAGDGHPVVLLHGAASAAEPWAALVGPLSARFRVILPLEIRHQEPNAIGSEPDGTGSFIWLRDFLDGLGLQRVSLIGGGEGETLAVDFAREEPERVEQLVLLGAMVPGESSVEELAEWVIRSLDAGEARVPTAPAVAAPPHPPPGERA